MHQVMDRYLDAIEAAVESNDKDALELLEKFAAHVYHQLHGMVEAATGDEQAVWSARLKRVQTLLTRMAQAAPSIWL